MSTAPNQRTHPSHAIGSAYAKGFPLSDRVDPVAEEATARKIAVFDYKITPNNPIGGCHLRMLAGLCREHQFTVFAVEFENPCPERIRWVRIPAPTRPLALLFVIYHLLAPLYYWAYCLRHNERFDLVQMVESNLSFGDVAYSQFCHRVYLKYYWKQSGMKGLRGWLRWLDHQLHVLIEPWAYRRVRRIVVASQGLARELKSEYPYTADKIRTVYNPVDLERMLPPEDFDRQAFRQRLGIDSQSVALVFVALGQFERKGIYLVLEALQRVSDPRLKLIVVGGESDLVTAYQAKVNQMGLSDRVNFVGMQRDIRQYLWGGDAFILPSLYEVFPLVALEAAGAGVPLIVSPLNGVEEFLNDGENGILVERTSEGVAAGIARFLALPGEARQALGKQAQQDVKKYATENFVTGWHKFYGDEDGD